MRINHVLVDYENVKADDIRELNREDVRVAIFLGSNQAKLPSELAIQMQELGARGEYIQLNGTGPNALDFLIAFTIGERAASGGPAYFHIISKDHGFDPLIAYLKSRKILAARSKSVGDLPFVKAAQPTKPSERAKYVVEKLSTPKSTKPRTEKTLANYVRTVFHGQLSDKDVEEVMAQLRSTKFLAIQEGKVTYRPSKNGTAPPS